MYWVQRTPSTAYTEYSIHQVQHKPKIVCLSFIPMITSWLLNLASASGVPPNMIDRHQPAWEVKGKVPLPHSHGCQLTNRWIESQHPAHCLSTATKYSSNHVRSWPPSVSPNLLDYSLQVCMIMASKCISPSSLNHGLQVHLHPRTITASKCISKLTQLCSRNVSANFLNHSLAVYLWVHSVVIFRRTLNCSQALPAASRDLPCVDG